MPENDEPKPIPPIFGEALREELARQRAMIADAYNVPYAMVFADIARDYAYRLDCQFLGIDPDRVPTRYERMRAKYRKRKRAFGWALDQKRIALAKRVSPVPLLTDSEAQDRYVSDYY